MWATPSGASHTIRFTPAVGAVYVGSLDECCDGSADDETTGAPSGIGQR